MSIKFSNVCGNKINYKELHYDDSKRILSSVIEGRCNQCCSGKQKCTGTLAEIENYLQIFKFAQI